MMLVVILLFIIIFVVIALSLGTTSKAYQYKHTIDPIDEETENKHKQR